MVASGDPRNIVLDGDLYTPGLGGEGLMWPSPDYFGQLLILFVNCNQVGGTVC